MMAYPACTQHSVGCVMTDPDYNYSHTLRDVMPDPRVQAVLARDFERYEIGTVIAWVRHGLQTGQRR